MNSHLTLLPKIVLSALAALGVAACTDDPQPVTNAPSLQQRETSNRDINDTVRLRRAYVHHVLRTNDGGILDYYLMSPDRTAAMPEGGFPLVVFLHGRGDNKDAMRMLRNGGQYFLYYRTDYPCYVAFPVCDGDLYWSYTEYPNHYPVDSVPTPEQTTVMYPRIMDLIRYLEENDPINPDRIVLCGYSMGAWGTLDIAARTPGMFAGVLALAGGINVNRAPDLFGQRMWLEHNANDINVEPVYSYALADRLVEMGEKTSEEGGPLTLKFYPDGDHAVKHLFQGPELMEWIWGSKLNHANNERVNDEL